MQFTDIRSEPPHANDGIIDLTSDKQKHLVLFRTIDNNLPRKFLVFFEKLNWVFILIELHS